MTPENRILLIAKNKYIAELEAENSKLRFLLRHAMEGPWSNNHSEEARALLNAKPPSDA